MRSQIAIRESQIPLRLFSFKKSSPALRRWYSTSNPPAYAGGTDMRCLMKLIIIHGPPAAGKLTVANEVAGLTGFKVFHNHLSIDCVKPVFEFGSEAFWRIVLTIRAETIAEAAREGIDILHTFCYAKGTDDENLARLIAAAEDNGGEVHMVLL